MDDERAELLSELGLSNYEARAYVTLARNGAMTADDVADESGVPTGRIYDVLNSLVDRSLARADDGRPRTYTHVEPGEAVGRLLERRVEELEQERSSYERTAAAAEDVLSDLQSEASGEGFATSALHDDAARDLLLERFAAADESVRIAIDTVDFDPEWSHPFTKRVEDLLEVGISVRLLATDFTTASERTKALLDAGLEVRRADAVPSQRFIVFDEREVCLEVPNPAAESELLAVVNFRDEDLGGRLADSFDDLWADAEPLSLEGDESAAESPGDAA
ncbi:TrmB family transcriptional regulator [Halopiger goleimassiliensis]|uniref:TrmB family transcriptional regulator n=1 Tax=Halopiger goleimassiliensis TaxID=1293048 RepID=UPI000678236F|nr:helix-turn-helix domain-containing protein [Halopiger goleimassiliensis]